jgi:hypothetical protein
MSTDQDFKMLDKAPYNQADPRACTELIFEGAKDVEKLYGPAFTAQVIKYALKAASTKTGESPPQDIKTLSQLTDYLVSKSDKLQAPPYFLAHWALNVTEKKLEGSLGVGYGMAFKGEFKKVLSTDGNEKLSSMDMDAVMAKLRKLTVNMKIAPTEFGYKKNRDGSLDIFQGGCPYLEGCRIAQSDATLRRPDGRVACGSSEFVTHFLKESTGYDWDHDIVEFGKPYCVTRLFVV